MAWKLASSLAALALTLPPQAAAGVALAATGPTEIQVGDLGASQLQPYSSAWEVVEIANDGTARVAERSFDELRQEILGGRRPTVGTIGATRLALGGDGLPWHSSIRTVED